jgi:hypothetical protein
MVSTLDLLKRRNDHGVKYVLVGGMACVIHRSQVVTQDVDICAPLTWENLSVVLELETIRERLNNLEI